MDLVLTLVVLGVVGTGVAIVLVYRRLLAGPKSLPVSTDWISDLSIARYRPMERLLGSDDYRFLASQPGVDRKMLRRIRSVRHRIFRSYLDGIRGDFNLVTAALRLMMAHSAQDRPDLAGILFRQQMLFAFGMLAVEWRLALFACGLGTVDVSGMVRVMETMRLELRHMIPAESAAAA